MKFVVLMLFLLPCNYMLGQPLRTADTLLTTEQKDSNYIANDVGTQCNLFQLFYGSAKLEANARKETRSHLKNKETV